MFVYSETSGASNRQLAELAGQPSTPAAPASPDHAQPRRFVDGAARALTSPFRSLVHSSSLWALELAGVLGALLVYGFGLGFLARYARF